MKSRALPSHLLAEKPWDACCKLQLIRQPFHHQVPGFEHIYNKSEVLDTGVNFFVLALEALGAKPRFSCEGHPDGFYLSFEAPYSVVTRLRMCTSDELYAFRFNTHPEALTGFVWGIYMSPARSVRTRNRRLRELALKWQKLLKEEIKRTRY